TVRQRLAQPPLRPDCRRGHPGTQQNDRPGAQGEPGGQRNALFPGEYRVTLRALQSEVPTRALKGPPQAASLAATRNQLRTDRARLTASTSISRPRGRRASASTAVPIDSRARPPV